MEQSLDRRRPAQVRHFSLFNHFYSLFQVPLLQSSEAGPAINDDYLKYKLFVLPDHLMP